MIGYGEIRNFFFLQHKGLRERSRQILGSMAVAIFCSSISYFNRQISLKIFFVIELYHTYVKVNLILELILLLCR